MAPEEIKFIVDKAMALLGPKFDSDEARVMMYAIGYQESLFKHRKQMPLRKGMPFGPARSFWQFEKNGGVAGVLSHQSTKEIIRQICSELGVTCLKENVWQMMGENDALGACMARLLLYTDPRPLPMVGDTMNSWQYYLDNWRPGKPHPSKWNENYRSAMRVFTGGF
jgi:hypothetical protein